MFLTATSPWPSVRLSICNFLTELLRSFKKDCKRLCLSKRLVYVCITALAQMTRGRQKFNKSRRRIKFHLNECFALPRFYPRFVVARTILHTRQCLITPSNGLAFLQFILISSNSFKQGEEWRRHKYAC